MRKPQHVPRNKHTRIGILFLLASSVLWGQPKIYPERWVYIRTSLANDEALMQFRDIARTAAGHGMNGVMLSSDFDGLDLRPAAYIDRLKAAKAECDRLHLELIPGVFYPGYSQGILDHDKNLAEGLLAKDVLFQVESGKARHVPENSTSFANGGFEEGLKGYLPGPNAVLDTGVAHSGRTSLRLEGFVAKEHGSAHVGQDISVKPYREYRFSFWLKTEDVNPPVVGEFDASTPDDRRLHPWHPQFSGTSGWRQFVSGFNSASAGKVRLNIGVFAKFAKEGATGKLWIDDIQVEEVGLLNVLRRAGTPVTVRDEKTGIVYREGKDYAPIADPHLDFQWNHDSPSIAILPGGRITEGARLRVSYYHANKIYEHDVNICLSEPAAYRIWDNQIKLVHGLLAPRKYMINTDEVRMGNSCETCKRRGLTSAQILGDATTREFQAIRKLDPKADVYVWSDMYDLNHNARDKYYLWEGDLTNSWKYIPKELKIVCWYFQKRRASLDFFSKLGFETVAGAYYDKDNLENPKGWLEDLDRTPGAVGIMYTTWLNKYALLADFGDLVSKR